MKLLLLAAAAVANAAASAPNILFILADDLGWGDIFNSNISTPNIHALLDNGVRLSHYYGQPVCSPSRAAIHTGRYPIAYGLQTYVIDPAGVDYGLNLNETTLAQVLKAQGNYATYAVGKWHMGMARWEQTPTFRGYDSFHGYYSGGQDYYTHTESGAFDLHIDNGPQCGANCSIVDYVNKDTYSTILYSQVAAQKLQAHDQSQPFFMYLAYQAVHAPSEVPQQYVWPYNKTIPNPERRQFAGMVAALDEGVGNVTAALKATGMYDNTLILFVADNGGPIFGGDSIGSTNYPLRGGKHGLFEGGVRLTAIASGPMVHKSSPGVNVTGRMHHVDWFPTLLEAVGINYTSPSGFPLHGVSAWPMLTQGAPSARNETLLNIDPCQPAGLGMTPGQGNAALIAGQWKIQVGMTGPPWNYGAPGQLTVGSEGTTDSVAPTAPLACATQLWPLTNMTTQLYNLETDPFERVDLATQYPQVVSELLSRLEYWGTQVQVPPYWPTATVDPASAPSKRNNTWTPWLP